MSHRNPITRRAERRTFLYQLPWNGVFWGVVVVLVSVAAALTAGVEIKRWHATAGGAVADIANGETVTVAIVLNGDELLVEKAGARARVRMIGIYAFDPVVNEFEITAFGRAAISFLEQWALGRPVRLNFDEPIRDTRGRYLAHVERDGIDLNRRMIEEGVAIVYTEYETAQEAAYLTAERPARTARRGIWGGKRSTLRIRALRHKWAAARLARTGAAPPDMLEEE